MSQVVSQLAEARADWLSAASLHDGALAAVADLALTLLVLLFRSPTDLVVP